MLNSQNSHVLLTVQESVSACVKVKGVSVLCTSHIHSHSTRTVYGGTKISVTQDNAIMSVCSRKKTLLLGSTNPTTCPNIPSPRGGCLLPEPLPETLRARTFSHICIFLCAGVILSSRGACTCIYMPIDTKYVCLHKPISTQSCVANPKMDASMHRYRCIGLSHGIFHIIMI